MHFIISYQHFRLSGDGDRELNQAQYLVSVQGRLLLGNMVSEADGPITPSAMGNPARQTPNNIMRSRKINCDCFLSLLTCSFIFIRFTKRWELPKRGMASTRQNSDYALEIKSVFYRVGG